MWGKEGTSINEKINEKKNDFSLDLEGLSWKEQDYTREENEIKQKFDRACESKKVSELLTKKKEDLENVIKICKCKVNIKNIQKDIFDFIWSPLVEKLQSPFFKFRGEITFKRSFNVFSLNETLNKINSFLRESFEESDFFLKLENISKTRKLFVELEKKSGVFIFSFLKTFFCFQALSIYEEANELFLSISSNLNSELQKKSGLFRFSSQTSQNNEQINKEKESVDNLFIELQESLIKKIEQIKKINNLEEFSNNSTSYFEECKKIVLKLEEKKRAFMNTNLKEGVSPLEGRQSSAATTLSPSFVQPAEFSETFSNYIENDAEEKNFLNPPPELENDEDALEDEQQDVVKPGSGITAIKDSPDNNLLPWVIIIVVCLLFVLPAVCYLYLEWKKKRT